MNTEEKVTEEITNLVNKLQQLTAERDEFVSAANQRIAFLNGKIEVLGEMLEAARSRNAIPATNGEVIEAIPE